MTKTTFQLFLHDVGNLAMHIASQNYRIPHPDSPCFNEALNEAVMQYIGMMLQIVPEFRRTIYGYVTDYYPHTLEASLRRFYRHEETIRNRAEREDSHGRHLYDPAEFLVIQNRVDQASQLVESVLRKNIHVAKNVPGAAFARIYAEYDQEYRAAAYLKDDSDYVFASIYFYRLEHALALSLIANIAEYMSANNLKHFDFAAASPLLTDTGVPDVDMPQSRSFCAWPNLLSIQEQVPVLFSGDTLSSVLVEDFGSRTLKQNILERLPRPEQYGKFDMSEVAAFIRKATPIIESHIPVSFYLNDTEQEIDKGKIKLARMLMRQIYSFASEESTQQL